MIYFKIDNKGIKSEYKFSKNEFETYSNISITIWGGIPHDVNWAVNLPIYQKALADYKLNPEKYK